MSAHIAAASASDDDDWIPPTEEEYQGLRKYKSFIMPLDTPYTIGEFVWMHHDKCRPTSESPRPASKRARPSLTPSQREGSHTSSAEGEALDLDKAEEEERQRQRREVNRMWKAGHWIGRIIEVRAKGNTYVWMKIRWMCKTIKELKEQDVKTGLPRSKPAGREMFMLGPEYDAVQPVGTVEGRVPVVLFDESNPIPPEDQEIDDETIWYRSEARMPNEVEMELLHPGGVGGSGVESGKAKGKGKRGRGHIARHLFPYQPTSCYCGDPYLPIAAKPELMALCPNPGCLRWFHLGCLDWTGGEHDHRLPSLTPSSLAYIRSSGLLLASYLDPSSHPHVPPLSASTVSSFTLPTGRPQDPAAPEARMSQTALRRALTPAWSWAHRNPQAEGLPADTKPSVKDTQALLEIGLSESLMLASEARGGSAKEREGGLDERIGEEVLAAAEGVIIRGKGYGTGGNARKILSARWIVHRASLSPASASAAGGEEDEIVKMVREWEDKWGGVEGVEVRRCAWTCPGCERLM
ncbi:hypothetical protein IAR50_007309 [Cryptococcus sp. DSM 104548]